MEQKEAIGGFRRSDVGPPAIYNIKMREKAEEELLMKGRIRCVALVTLMLREVLLCSARVQPPANRDRRPLVPFPVTISSFKVDRTALVRRYL